MPGVRKRAAAKRVAATDINPSKLKVGDLVRFTALPDEWNRGDLTLHKDSLVFMKTMIRRRFPSRVYEIDESGTPWIAARIRRRGRVEYHCWGIFESTGWRLVRRTCPTQPLRF